MMDISPYICAIQTLNGSTPGEKYKELHTIATQIVKNKSETKEFLKTGESKRIQPGLLPYLCILVGNKLKVSSSVLTALKSDDVTVIKQALNAKWFFSSSNDLINVEYFIKNVVPHVSLRTRLELIKTLANCLVGEPKKANDFFDSFADLYGLEQALPLIVACSEKYIFDAVLKRRIVLPSRFLGVLYRRYPQLVIRYLQLGDEKNETNKEDRKLHTISLIQYRGFLPVLVKHHTHAFIEFCEHMPECTSSIQLGNTRAEFFLKNATDVLIKKPEIFLGMLPLKLISNKLSMQQFETMYENLLPKSVDSFNVHTMLTYLKYYPQEKKLDLLKEKYKLRYNQNLEDSDILDSIMSKKIMPADLKEKIGRKKVEPYIGKPEYYDYLQYLPPKEAIPLLKERISKATDKPRIYYIKKMIESCAYYDSEDDLCDVLSYYNKRHKNEQPYVLYEFFEKLSSRFELKSLSRSHWTVLREILERAFVRGDIFGAMPYIYKPIFRSALYFYLKQCKTQADGEEFKTFLDRLVGMILECYLEHNMQWEFILDGAEIERDCLQKFLTVLPQKYPLEHVVWNNFDIKLNLIGYLVKAIHIFNVKNMYTVQSKKKYSKGSTTTMDSEGKEVRHTKFVVKTYGWLAKLVTDVLKSKNLVLDKKNKKRYGDFTKVLRKHDAQFYQSIVNSDPLLLYNVEDSDATTILKHNPRVILEKWELYLQECKNSLLARRKSTKRFVTATKWYQLFPVKFIKKCVEQIEEKGSILILGILLEGEAFAKIVQPYLPKDKKVDLANDAAKQAYDLTASVVKAINCTNPPVSFDVIATYCQGDYVTLAAQMLSNVAQRVSVHRVLEFANTLVNNKHISVKKLGIRLVIQVSSKIEARQFLKKIWNTETHSSIREVLVEMIFEVFQHSPSEQSWELVKMCINGLTEDDETAMEILNDIEVVDKNFVAAYIQELLKKLDEFPDKVMDKKLKGKFIKNLSNKIDENIAQHLPEGMLTDIVKQYFFEHDIEFTVNLYLLSNENKLEERLKIIIEILNNEMKEFDKSDKVTGYYPVRFAFYRFFVNVTDTLYESKKKVEIKVKLIDEMLKLFSTLKPCRAPNAYINLKICKAYFSTTTAEEFGTKCGENLKLFVEEFATELILKTVAKGIEDVLNRIDCFKEADIKTKLDIIAAMRKVDQHCGSLVGIMLLNQYDLDSLGTKYDLMKPWIESDDVAVQTVLSQFINPLYCW